MELAVLCLLGGQHGSALAVNLQKARAVALVHAPHGTQLQARQVGGSCGLARTDEKHRHLGLFATAIGAVARGARHWRSRRNARIQRVQCLLGARLFFSFCLWHDLKLLALTDTRHLQNRALRTLARARAEHGGMTEQVTRSRRLRYLPRFFEAPGALTHSSKNSRFGRLAEVIDNVLWLRRWFTMELEDSALAS